MIDITHYISRSALRQLVAAALDEDLGQGDLTSDLLIPDDLIGSASVRTRSAGVVAGLGVAGLVFQLADERLQFEQHVAEGAACEPGQELATVRGPLRGLLRGERVALNFAQRLSGIATLTAQYVAAVRGTRARIVDTRKTTPGLRAMEKYAVRAGGGRNHRRDLGDAVMIKDNHLAALARRGIGLVQAVAELRDQLPHTVTIEIEVDRLDQIAEVLEAGANTILLDNMTPAQLRAAVEQIDGRAQTEASGGVSLHSVAAIAASGVDIISVGALTHSAPALDIGLDMATED
ncbi:MAG: carboxylating nicotinate-nucleotide diphosphorylase [Roseiflexaceae bacterium]|nr:carboxylating nicotinate-nucleotide diphosphorylase [Roseiflexaceae bacterium]